LLEKADKSTADASDYEEEVSRLTSLLNQSKEEKESALLEQVVKKGRVFQKNYDVH